MKSRRGSTASSSIRARRDESEQRRDAKAEEIWQEGAASEEDDNRSILTRAASLEDLETGSIVREGVETGSVVETGSGVSESRRGGGVNVIRMKINEACVFKPQEGKWVYIDYNPQLCKTGEYLQPMLFNTIVERNLRESKFSPRAGDKRSPAIYIINTNDFVVQLRRGETLGTLVRLASAEEAEQDEGDSALEDEEICGGVARTSAGGDR